jgi:hypothetical protein
MDTETLVEQIFTDQGFDVVRISEVHDEERADYRVTDSNDSYVIEVKDKFDANSMLAEYHQRLDAGDVFVRSESTGYKNAVSNVFDKAESQLAASIESDAEHRIVWIELAGIDRKLQFQQTIATIYGTVQLLPIGPSVVTKECYYFTYNVVNRNPQIDAFIVCDGQSCLLATNPFSPRFQSLSATKLYGIFADKDAIVDPVALEQAEAIYVADCAISRRDTQAVLEYVQTKYGVARFLDLQPVSTTASTAVIPQSNA